MNISPAIQNIHDIIALEKTPLSERTLPKTTWEALQRGTAIDPSAPALSFFVSAQNFDKPIVVKHGEFMARVTQTANALRRLGIGRTDVVAYILPNLPDTHYVIWGGSAAGRVLAINPMLEADQIADLLRAANTKIVVTLEKTPKTNLWEKTLTAIASVPSVERILTCSVFDYLPTGAVAVGIQIVSSFRSVANRTITAGDKAISVSRLSAEMKKEDSIDLNFEPPQPSDISTMLCTGGTTGLPKIAQRSHWSEVYDSWAISQFNPVVSTPGASVFCGLPLFHSNAILVTGLVPFMNGGHVVLATPQGYRGDGVFANFWKLVDYYRFVTFSGVPTVYATLLNIPRDGLDISSIKFAVCGAAPMPVELFNTFVDQTGIPIIEGYGLTEGAVASSLNPTEPDRRRIGSIGLRLPYQQMRCAILDDNDQFNRWADVDEAGSILISGPNLFEGYVIESQNKGTFLKIQGETWLNTGDLARQDVDGYFWMTGRKKELIIRGGHNIDPKIVEEAMHKHSAVAMAAVVGRPDAKVGEVPVMYYQEVAGASATQTELAEFAVTHVSEQAAIPKDFIKLDALPMTTVGKIHKVTLNMMEIERTIRKTADDIGADLISLRVDQDSSRGIIATISAGSNNNALAKALGAYAFNITFIED